MINVEMKHDVKTGKAVGLMMVLGVVTGASMVITKEIVDYGKDKIKNKKMNKIQENIV